MDMEERTQGAVALMDVSGKLVAGETDRKAQGQSQQPDPPGSRQIVLNLGGVPTSTAPGSANWSRRTRR